MPVAARQRPATSSSIGILTPRASRTSPLPHLLEIERLPCLITGSPQAAVSNAVPVEMLREPDASPPVPTMSMARVPAGICGRSASARMPSAKPRSSCGHHALGAQRREHRAGERRMRVGRGQLRQQCSRLGLREMLAAEQTFEGLTHAHRRFA
jgi:hypothetical protein